MLENLLNMHFSPNETKTVTFMLGTVQYHARGNASDGKDSLAARNSATCGICPTHGEKRPGKTHASFRGVNQADLEV